MIWTALIWTYFTCNEGDECDNPHHRMTRKDCYAYRNECFEYLLTNNILPSSEEANDWSMPSLVFCHYAPYELYAESTGHSRNTAFRYRFSTWFSMTA